MEIFMKKTALFLGLAAMLFATPVFAAAKPAAHMAAKHATMCMVKGKKVHCKHHVMHHPKHHAVHHAAKKVAKKK
jgi:hypothetical protein